MIPGQRFGYPEDIRVCNFCLKLIGSSASVGRVSDDRDQRLFRSNSVTSIDPVHGSLDRAKLRSPSFYKEEKKKSTVPFRMGIDDEEQDIEWTSYFTDDEMNTFVGQDHQVPKSFVKIQTKPESGTKSVGWKSPSFITRRKFSTRFRFQSESELQDLPKHFQSVSAALNVEINAASVNHIRLLMRQMLVSAKIDQIPEWENVIFNMLLNVCNKLSPDIRSGDEIDIRHYVKIKRIPGGQISDSMYVNGVVASKKALHKKMLNPVTNPKILLITFPIEYQRIEGQFISLEVLIAQEKDHLKNLTARMIRLKPDVIMVEKTVGRIAFDLLLEANIIVIPNVKMNVLNAVARCTKADIVHSVDKLSVQSLGTCDCFSFKIFTESLIPGLRKTFLWVEGCAEQLGCTLVLRGSEEATLKSIKEIVDFLCFVIYSLKLETCLFQDQYAQTPNIEDMPSVQTEHVSELRKVYNMYMSKILSGSPNVQFPPPYLLQKAIEEEKLGELPSEQTHEIRKPEDLDETSLSFLPKFSLSNMGPLSPFTQQNIMVLYSNISKSSMMPCVDPQPHLIEYYRDSDLTLGQFIEDMCFGAKFNCPVKTCEQLMLMHYRTYAHGQGRVTVTIDSLPCPVEGMSDRIMMWSLCKVCREATPFIPMSEETWKYSFGKYLELTFYHSTLRCRATVCTHDIYKEHTRFFAFRNLTIRFDYETIDLYNVCGPPMRRKPKVETITNLRHQDMDTIRLQINTYYDSVLERIQNFTYDIVSPTRIPQCRDVMSEFSKKASSERKLMLQLLQQTIVQCQQYDYLSLNVVYKTLLENVGLWDTEFSNFIRTHLQSDSKDLRRITATQIKRIFQDKDNNSENRQTIVAGNENPRTDHSDTDPSEKSSPFADLNLEPGEIPSASDTVRKLSTDLQQPEEDEFPLEAESPENPIVLRSPRRSHSFAELREQQLNITPEQRPTSIMQTITNLWNGNPANFLPLAYPSNQGEHVFQDSLVIVREDEPSSIVSFALLSEHYRDKLKGMRTGAPLTESKKSQDNSSYFIGFDDNPTDIEETLLKETGTHILYQFWDGSTKIQCKIYFAEKFDALRRNCGIHDIFEQSLARCVKWDASGGKSGTYFMKTRDDWLVVKKLSQVELESLISFSPAYFEYMSQAFFHELPTVLAKIYGFYHITYKNPTTRKTIKMDILVMENIFYEHTNISRIFDLKGSIRNRHVQSTGKQNEVLLDKNLLEFIYESPLFIREHSKKLLGASVHNDTLFLSQLNVMDYSLLVGIDNENKQLIIGIVDFIRTFTWDKKLESWVKETGLLGGGKEPTIVTPRQYKNRFREAMERYFLMVPEKYQNLTNQLSHKDE